LQTGPFLTNNDVYFVQESLSVVVSRNIIFLRYFAKQQARFRQEAGPQTTAAPTNN
jgi:hypothetical protein